MRSGVLFDVDGTLVDSTYLHTVAWWEALRQQGADVPMATIHRAIGMGSDKLLDHLLGPDRDHDKDAESSTAHDVLYGAWWERLRPLPGAADLLRAVAGRGLAVALASSAKAPELEHLRRVIDADDVIDAATSSSDAAESKPAPDILQAALDQSGIDPEAAVFVGDSIWDVKAAATLNIPCIGLTCGGTSADELTEAGAAAVHDDPAALLAALDKSAIADLSVGERAQHRQ
ncbi:HAD family hydrolase [Paractinoplanes atraurantiacus]|uniref:Haloacid dehalogenase superfamily, subfamily IA, variant 3 with third motif having DD or ED/haloacid dehalogenase superfamily, subfamily IA, variant 1 with third motif having Dx(3-4)D or Dx(3-4)E n=1 Tax=Paractinoplanes atraurantiacus TaxID=1036182 RepID=A0A285IHK0_9ACTN|nr:HAD family hydrolase [Actinoplanes atraurantiacus]SNY47393.1 haloacid dehalogenase superfamily, subfamily IA, variant 3 with third motif having DD or ED/haloacid dehalogenase superfamily, subfamily IA, variant 1 with third motif having Dx(3-4)D or Dx(3-4)E [Actinoplanes atraurantiacus]